MVRYTIENTYTGSKINYTNTLSTSLTKTTLNTETVTWDTYTTIVSHTTSRDTIPGTTSTTAVDTTSTFKAKSVTKQGTEKVYADRYLTVSASRTTGTWNPDNPDGFDMNLKYTDTVSFMVSDFDGLVGKVTATDSYMNVGTETAERIWYVTMASGSGGGNAQYGGGAQYYGNQGGVVYSGKDPVTTFTTLTTTSTSHTYEQGLSYTDTRTKYTLEVSESRWTTYDTKGTTTEYKTTYQVSGSTRYTVPIYYDVGTSYLGSKSNSVQLYSTKINTVTISYIGGNASKTLFTRSKDMRKMRETFTAGARISVTSSPNIIKMNTIFNNGNNFKSTSFITYIGRTTVNVDTTYKTVEIIE